LPDLVHTASFSPADDPVRILADLACPACGHHEPGPAYDRVVENKIRVFCDCCGAFVTITVSDEQAHAIRRWSARPAAFDGPSRRPPREAIR
jgi:hypothetical protein